MVFKIDEVISPTNTRSKYLPFDCQLLRITLTHSSGMFNVTISVDFFYFKAEPLWNLDSLYPGRVFVLLQIAEAAEDVCAFKEART
jgi:hypothetical protein